MIEQWFLAALKAVSPRLEVSWEMWDTPVAYALPAWGRHFQRVVYGEKIQLHFPHRTHIDEAATWTEVEAGVSNPWRYVVWERTLKERRKLFDCVDDQGRNMPLDQDVINAAAGRKDVWEKALPMLRAQQKKNRELAKERARTYLHPLAVDHGNWLRGDVQVAVAATPKARANAGFVIQDRRRFAHYDHRGHDAGAGA